MGNYTLKIIRTIVYPLSDELCNFEV